MFKLLIPQGVNRRKTLRSATTLVELLVVIVVFLIGILAVVQIFPAGFRILNITRNQTIATALARQMSEQLKSRPDQLPDAIVPVIYRVSGFKILIEEDPARSPNDLGPQAGTLDQVGLFHDAGNRPLGNWQYLTGANVSRRVLGEGKIIPTPRVIGTQYGALMILQFAPIVYSSAYASIFVVYGNDFTMRLGDPDDATFPVPVRPYEFWLDEADSSQAELIFASNRIKNTRYRVNLTIDVSNGATVSSRSLVDVIVDVPVDPTGANDHVLISSIAGLLAGETLVGVQEDTVQVARTFDQLNLTDPWDASGDPYEFKLLSPEMGLVLFSPAGYNFQIRRSNSRRDPLVGRADYDVYDWRIIREEFRAPDIFPPDATPPQYRLALGSLKVTGESNVDGTPNQGISIPVPDGAGGTQTRDLILQDLDTGGIFLFAERTKDPNLSSYTVNKSIGLITLLDHDGDPTNGVQMMLIPPDSPTPVEVTVTNRNLRALYMGKGDWAVQVLKPSARYRQTLNGPVRGQFYIGGSGTWGVNGRVYFPPMDAGRVVTLGQVYYVNAGGATVGPIPVTGTIGSTPADPSGFPYVQVSDFLPDFVGFDYNTYGAAVLGVKGASVAVRVLWNPDSWHLTSDSPTNLSNLNKWMQGWRRSTVETYLQRGY